MTTVSDDIKKAVEEDLNSAEEAIREAGSVASSEAQDAAFEKLFVSFGRALVGSLLYIGECIREQGKN